MNAETFLASLLDDAVAKVPQARDLRDFFFKAGLSLRDCLDHAVLPVGDHRPIGWTCVAPGIWRHDDGAPALLDAAGVGVALRVDDVAALLRTLQVERPIEGAAYGPFRRARLFEAEGVAFDIVERCGWTGFDLPEVSERQIRRARIHYQTLASRRRSFREPEQGYNFLGRLLEAAAADLGPMWASGVFLRAERVYWQSQCAAGQAQAWRQAGIGWGNAAYFVFPAAREHFRRAAGFARLLGYRPGVWGAGAERGFAVFACPLLSRPAIVLETDGSAAPSADEAAPTWLGPAGLWCALHGEGLLEGGARALCAYGAFGGLHELRAVPPHRVDALERERYLARTAAEELRLNGAEGALLHAAVHGARITPPAFVHLGAVEALTAQEAPRRQRHRIKRQR